MGEEKTIKLLKLINENSVKLRDILKEVDEEGEVDEIIAGGRGISPKCSEHVKKKDIAGAESVSFDVGELIIELVEDKKVKISKDSRLLSDEGYEEKKQRYVDKLEAEDYEVEEVSIK